MTGSDAIARLLEAAWNLPPPLRIESLTTGVNNASYLVGTDADDYVLKHYRNVDAASRLPFEHALLRALGDADLPFAVPVPLPTTTGGPVAVEQDGDTFSLARRIPGIPGWRGDLALATRAGRALALLDRALATVDLPPGLNVPGTYPPLGASGRRLARALGGDRDLAREIAGILDRAERQLTETTAGWPNQIIHSDYFPSNILVDDGAVSGVIDFEFASSGHLAMDFAIGLVAFGTEGGAFMPHLDRMEAFAAGYFAVGTLSPDERSAVPVLILIREAGSFTHWLGRMESGLTPPDDLRERARRLLDLDAWVTACDRELVTRLGQIQADRANDARRPVP